MPELTNINNLIASLAASAELLATEMRNRTAGGRYPSGLSGSIAVGQVNNLGDKLTVRISVMHPAGAAYEWGSGIHAERGVKETYPIRAKDKLLKFPFTLTFMPGSKFAGMKGVSRKRIFQQLQGDTGQVSGETYWYWVDHPGVEARPYVEPSIQAKRKEIAKMVGRGFVASITRKEKEIVEIRVDV